ncbi:MAG: CDP-alcohol phosphatidyltransferase family protein [Eubacteriales bacterium]|nr:CDP-alcohol phosphatidyltransferase family protein [Eubacteriales bacterium]
MSLRKHLTRENILTVPNLLTLVRLLLIPVMAKDILDSRAESLSSAFLFFGIWLSDFLDGFIARHFNCISDLGKILDPLADKIFQIVTAFCLYRVDHLPLWVVLFLLVKDLILIIGSALMFGRDIVVQAHWYGKVATVLFALAFGSVFVLPDAQSIYTMLLLYASVFMGGLAFFAYLHSFFETLRSGRLKQGAK